MDNVDRDKLRGVIERDPLLAIYRAHGDDGTRSFRELALGIQTIYRHIEPENFDGMIVAFKCLDDSDRPIPESSATVIRDMAALSQEIEGNVAIQVLSDGRLLLWKNVDINISLMAETAVVYRYNNRREYFFARDAERELPNVGPYASLYAVPSFSDLRQAIEQYRIRMAKESSCKILQGVWKDENRLLFVSAPEATMRDSLYQFLYTTFRDADVRPEQNMGESYPVDIKVNFSFSNRLAVIEIKWVGNSIKSNGKMVTHRDARARKGARQLADYLNKNIQRAPTHITRGYLVVFDGRRRRVSKGTKTVNRDDGGHYRQRDLNFDPKYHEERDDFEAPIRMFMEPICEP